MAGKAEDLVPLVRAAGELRCSYLRCRETSSTLGRRIRCRRPMPCTRAGHRKLRRPRGWAAGEGT